jgi:diguanylate cyclase (GGDEF)-like protein
MRHSLRDILQTLNFFALVCTSALSISFIVSIIVYRLGIPVDAPAYVRLNLFVTACIALPTALIVSLHDFQARMYRRKLEALAWTDELTGLLNRRFFMRAADEECRRMRRTQRTAAIAVIDLDHFKEINDLYGHAAGDEVLKGLAQVAYAELRGPFDKLGRWGGEEFVVLLSDVTSDQARIVCDRLRTRIQESLIRTGLYQINVTASFGYCMLSAGSDVNAVIEAADRALYEAKRLGRNRVETAEYRHPDVQDLSEFKKRNAAAFKRATAFEQDTLETLRAAAVEKTPRFSRQGRAR